ncbi:hypothetical protein F5Y15DRAFT_418803 [Xylariaceae sp. FL0016]|nr:hypothetical protein F5Y15DRAFT_418803 [Xylariaceae sp. FL0016]
MPITTCNKAFIGIAALAVKVSAFWRLPCSSPVVVERADPIVWPGQVSTHAHTIMGSNAFNFTMSYDLTQTATCSTCKPREDRSSYWVPNLYYHAENGSFIPVKQSGGALIYYLYGTLFPSPLPVSRKLTHSYTSQRTDPKDPNPEEGLIAFPKGFRMLAGDPMLRNYSDVPAQRAVSFVCLGVEGPATPDLPRQNCPNGLRAQLSFPSCWDGRNLDAPDHRSHMAYPSGVDTGYCPPTHPRRFISIFYEVTWSVDDFKDMWYGGGGDKQQQQPFVFSNGDPTGYGYHADFINGWELGALQRAIDECTDDSGVIERCGALTLRSDEEMAACRVLPRVDEPVAGGGVLAALPGCNPVQPGPEPAVLQEQEHCGAPTEIGDPVLPFTDVARRLGWRYVACARDPAGQSRTLDGFGADEGDMTVDACVALCDGKGFRYAGVEWSHQCFCGNEVAGDRMPANGTTGDCSMPCAGDAKQFCGGSAEVSVYTKCTDADCTNEGVPR